MENVKIIENAEQQPDIVADEKENFDAFNIQFFYQCYGADS